MWREWWWIGFVGAVALVAGGECGGCGECGRFMGRGGQGAFCIYVMSLSM